jgi:hypothetical protein
MEQAVRTHLAVLDCIERGERTKAEALLGQLNRQHPDYLPGIMERSLLHLRNGERSLAIQWMHKLMLKARTMPLEQILPGPEPAPVRFYTMSARAFLNSLEAGGGVSDG